MAFFHRTLKEMKQAIETENWNLVMDILKQHNKHPDTMHVQHKIGDISKSIKTYDDNLRSINMMLASYREHGTTRRAKQNKEYLIRDVDKAIEAAEHFEEVIHELIRKGKFMY